MQIRIRQGLDVDSPGAPRQVIDAAPASKRVAVLGRDYANIRPSLAVEPGEAVTLGQVLFRDRRQPALCVTSPATGRVAAIKRGPKRAVEAVVIDVDGSDELETAWVAAAASDARSDGPSIGPSDGPSDGLSDAPTDTPIVASGAVGQETGKPLPVPFDEAAVRRSLLSSGLWTAIRSRPFGGVAMPEDRPQALFVTAMDTRPWAPDPGVVMAGREQAFAVGVSALSRLSDRLFVCKGSELNVSVADAANVSVVDFAGPHPAGLPGTHIEWLAPISGERVCWHIDYQDVIAVGRLLGEGRLSCERCIALAGPGVARPRLLRTRIGASIDELTAGELEGSGRVLSGSPLAGYSRPWRAQYLGRYDSQISVLEAATDAAGEAMPSLEPGSPAAPGLLPVEAIETVWPFSSPPLVLLRSLLACDLERAEALGCLGLVEEDLALSAYLSPAKLDFGSALRSVLHSLERSR